MIGFTRGSAVLAALGVLVAAQGLMAGDRSLPPAVRKVGMSVEEALSLRRSTRTFVASREVTLAELSQLLWATAGVNRPDGKRTHPSALASYGVEVWVADAGGVWRYRPVGHDLVAVELPEGLTGDMRRVLPARDFAKETPVLVLLVADLSRYPAKFPEDLRLGWAHFEAGCMAQNLALQCEALGLGTCVNAGFDAAAAARLVGSGRRLLYVLPVGAPVAP